MQPLSLDSRREKSKETVEPSSDMESSARSKPYCHEPIRMSIYCYHAPFMDTLSYLEEPESNRWIEQQGWMPKNTRHLCMSFCTHSMVSASHNFPRQMNMYSICGPEGTRDICGLQINCTRKDLGSRLVKIFDLPLGKPLHLYPHPLPECSPMHVDWMLISSLMETPSCHKRAQHKGILSLWPCMLLVQFALSISYPMNPENKHSLQAMPLHQRPCWSKTLVRLPFDSCTISLKVIVDVFVVCDIWQR